MCKLREIRSRGNSIFVFRPWIGSKDKIPEAIEFPGMFYSDRTHLWVRYKRYKGILDRYGRGMPQVKKSKYWFIRVDGAEEDLRRWCDEMVGTSVSWLDSVALLAIKHNGSSQENPHLHCVLELSKEIQQQSIGKRIKTMCGFTADDSREWSVKIWDGKRGRGACSYMFHEDENLILKVKGFSDNELNEMREANQVVQEEIKVGQGKKNVIEECINEVKEMELKRHYNIWTLREFVFNYIMKAIRNNRMNNQDDRTMKMIIEEVILKSRKDEEFESYTKNKFSALFHWELKSESMV